MPEITYQMITCPSCSQGYSYQIALGVGCDHYISCRFCHSRIRIHTNVNSQIDRIVAAPKGENNMKTCPNCGRELKDEAKFCGGCGYKFQEVQSSQNSGTICPSCGNPLKPGAKFCGKCGTKIEAVQSSSKSDAEIAKQASFIQWNVLPGQLALKIDSQEIASYGRVKGLVVQEGLRALFFVNGKIISELAAGSYEFKSFPDVKTDADSEGKKQNIISTFFNNIKNFFRNTPQLPPNVQNVSVVLVRSVEFPLVFDVKDVATAGIRSEVGLHVLCKISNINEFYANELLDKKFIGFESIAQKLAPLVQTVLNSALSGVDPNNVASAQEKVLAEIQARIAQVYSYITATKVISLTASNQQLEQIRKMQEELYVSELELSELTKRNSFLNRLQDENNAQALRESRNQVEFQAALDKIDEDRELNEDERLKFSQMLEAQRMIREAKTEDEVDAAMQQFRKSGLLREEELDNLLAQTQQNAALRDLSYEQALNLATLANEKELDRQQLQWEIEIGNKRLENEIERQRMQDQYEDERREKERLADKAEMQDQLDMLRQAQAIRMERENAEHQRQMESMNAQNQHEEEMRRMFQNMTAEQIVAANPDITPEAANAMAEKFKAEAAAAANDRTAEMAMKQSADMQAFMKEQMQMMRDMAVAGMNANAANQQQMMAAKDAEMNRYSNGVNNAVSSVSGALKNPTTVVQQGTSVPGVSPVAPAQNAKASGNICPSCGTPHEPGAIFCENCGSSL